MYGFESDNENLRGARLFTAVLPTGAWSIRNRALLVFSWRPLRIPPPTPAPANARTTHRKTEWSTLSPSTSTTPYFVDSLNLLGIPITPQKLLAIFFWLIRIVTTALSVSITLAYLINALTLTWLKKKLRRSFSDHPIHRQLSFASHPFLAGKVIYFLQAKKNGTERAKILKHTWLNNLSLTCLLINLF